MNFGDAAKFAMADLVTREIQQQGSLAKGALTTGKQLFGIGGTVKGAETQSYTAGLSGSAMEAARRCTPWRWHAGGGPIAARRPEWWRHGETAGRR